MSTSGTATASGHRRAGAARIASSDMSPASAPSLRAGWADPETFLGTAVSERGQAHGEHRAAVRGVGRAHAAAVRVDDPGHDGQAEAGAALAALAPALGAPEALEQL